MRDAIEELISSYQDAIGISKCDITDNARAELAQLRDDSLLLIGSNRLLNEIGEALNCVPDATILDRITALQQAVNKARPFVELAEQELWFRSKPKEYADAGAWLAAHPAQQAEQEQAVSAVELAAYRFYLADPGSDDILFGLFEDMSADERERFKLARDKHMEQPS